MHRMFSLLPDVPSITVTYYADDICIHNPGGLPAFPVGNSVIPVCTQYVYLGVPVRILSSTPARQRDHPVVHDLLTQLQLCLASLRWLLNNTTGVSIPVARTIYTAYIRSVVDYLSPTLVQLPKSTLEPLEKFQNIVMRLILGCPMSTRIVNMLHELDFSPLIESIHANDPPSSLSLQPDGRAVIKTVCSQLQRLDINVPEVDIFPPPPPWMLPLPTVHFTPTCKAHPPVLQKQLALDAIASVSATIVTPHHLYMDGSVQADGTAGFAVFSPEAASPAES
ncbi:hypothetical protein E2C01_021757 [Portunus trituberculatus]|uniref:RNA-directed DNA polymerase from mobile element jockey n=1 Tax=Portunus trituberculatus TaxID=210409 RepID=A0A5B7E489_PORTR|nr:hypothetical protein [Portunus trituberculatus]